MKRIICTMLASALLTSVSSAKPKASITTSILKGEYSHSETYEPVSSFDCNDQIMALVDLSGFERGRESASVIWTDPNGKVRERVNMDVGLNRDGVGKFYSFIEFHKGKGAGIFSLISPTLSLEEFIGLWEVRIKVRGHTVGRHEFEVVC